MIEWYAPVRGMAPGVAAIDFDGDRYCIDCAPVVMDGREVPCKVAETGEWETMTDGQEITDGLISGDIETLGTGGVVLKHSTDGTDEVLNRCGRGGNCVHAVPGDEHDFSHNKPVGAKLNI